MSLRQSENSTCTLKQKSKLTDHSNWYPAPNIIKIKNNDEMSSACSKHGVMKNASRIFVGKGINHSEDIGVGGWKILKWILKQKCGRVRAGFISE
jgi:hypothetical protein